MIRKNSGFKYLEHTADVYIEAWGPTLEEVFKQCALAMYDIMTDINAFSREISRTIKVEGEGLKLLLYDWLEELLFIFGTEYLIFPEIEIKSITRKDRKYILHAECKGEKFNLSKHPPKTEVKAVTLNMMEIKKEKDTYIARVVFDI